MKNIWFCGIPGSKWSGIDIVMRHLLPADRSDETPNRTQYHRPRTKEDGNNGHRGSYWGPGMGCGEDWTDFNFVEPRKLTDDINNVFSGDGYRIIKSHFFARNFNLDYIYNHFPGDYIFLVYREPQKSFAWWSEVMCFDELHYPDYRPGYRDYNRMWELLWQESSKITDFAMRKNMDWQKYDPKTSFSTLPGFDKKAAKYVDNRQPDVYTSVVKIPGESNTTYEFVKHQT